MIPGSSLAGARSTLDEDEWSDVYDTLFDLVVYCLAYEQCINILSIPSREHLSLYDSSLTQRVHTIQNEWWVYIVCQHFYP